MIKVGLIGTGYIGPIHLDALSRIVGVKVKSVVDVNIDLARKAAADFNIENTGSDYRDLIKDPDIDVIHNCTPNKHHYHITKESLEAGKQVLSEKPLAMTLKEAETLVDIAQKKGAITGIDFCYRYYPVVQDLAARIHRGDAGDIRMATGSYFQDWLSTPADYSWRLEKAEGGESNITADLGSHWFDLIQFTTGLRLTDVLGDLRILIPFRNRPIHQVLAFENAKEGATEEFQVELEDYSAVLFQLSGGAPGSFTTCQVCSGRKSDTELQIYGSKCSYAWNHNDATRLWIGHREKPNEILIENPILQDPSTARFANLPAGHPLGYHDAVLNLFKEFYQAIREGKADDESQRPTFRSGYEEMKILKAILESNKKRSWVKVKD